MRETKGTILLGVTSDVSLGLMRGFPEFLVSRGWDTHVVSAPGPSLEALRDIPGLTAHQLQMVRDPSPMTDLGSLIRWVQLIRSVRPDVISVGTPKAGLLGGIAGKVAGVPSRVYHLRGLRLETTSGYQRVVLSVAEKVSLLMAHRVLSVSDSLREKVVALGLVRRSKVTVLGGGSSNGVDLGEFDSASFDDSELARLASHLGLESGIPVIGFVGRLTVDKGLDVLVDALEILDQVGIDYQVLVVGGTEDASARSSMNRLRVSGRRVAETGHAASPAIYYQLMDVLCLPTLREGFPNVVLEAAAAGVPSVTTDATGAVDAVVDRVTGLIVKAGSATSLATGLETALTDRELRRTLGNGANQHVKQHYARELVWSLLEEFYRASTGTVRRQRGGH